jgi:hypothetical protein
MMSSCDVMGFVKNEPQFGTRVESGSFFVRMLITADRISVGIWDIPLSMTASNAGCKACAEEPRRNLTVRVRIT